MERAKRSLGRLSDMQSEVDDIIKHRDYTTTRLMTVLLEQCTDLLEALTADQVGEFAVVRAIRERIDQLFGSKEVASVRIQTADFVAELIDGIREFFAHRDVRLITGLSATRSLVMPEEVLKKIVTGLTKNAIENTPDGGKVEIIVRDRSGGVELVVSDTGIGIIEEDQKLIFEGFYPTQDTNAYCSKRPYDFNAGGKGADLLRMVIFSERYKFKMGMTSSRCRFIPSATDMCPGSIDNCPNCSNIEDCYESGGTTFTVFFSTCGEKNLAA